MSKDQVTIRVNNKPYTFVIGDAYGEISNKESLSTTLRTRLNLTGTKEACSEGACGCCTVIMNGRAVPSCIQFTSACDGADIITIEGLRNPETRELDPIQQAFIDKYAFQCGYCTPGIIMTTKAFLMKNPKPTRTEMEDALSGNFCRCISHYHVFEAIEQVIEETKGVE